MDFHRFANAPFPIKYFVCVVFFILRDLKAMTDLAIQDLAGKSNQNLAAWTAKAQPTFFTSQL